MVPTAFSSLCYKICYVCIIVKKINNASNFESNLIIITKKKRYNLFDQIFYNNFSTFYSPLFKAQSLWLMQARSRSFF